MLPSIRSELGMSPFLDGLIMREGQTATSYRAAGSCPPGFNGRGWKMAPGCWAGRRLLESLSYWGWPFREKGGFRQWAKESANRDPASFWGVNPLPRELE
jgi:hypothetical protein